MPSQAQLCLYNHKDPGRMDTGTVEIGEIANPGRMDTGRVEIGEIAVLISFATWEIQLVLEEML